MKILHTADWHIGRELKGYSLKDEQEEAVEQIISIAKEENIDAMVIAGDMYDTTLPKEESVEELGRMLEKINVKNNIPILAIRGNHDSGIRLGNGSAWYKEKKYFIKTKYKDVYNSIELGDCQFFLLPYFELQQARNYFKDNKLITLNDIMEKTVTELKKQFKKNKRHILVGHFLALGSQRSNSEIKLEVGGLNAVDTSLFSDFDYVALGHLHNPRAISNEKIKYSGSILKYSLSEINQDKDVWIIDTENMDIRFRKLNPSHKMVKLEGSVEELTSNRHGLGLSDLVAITITDKEIVPNVYKKLNEYYPRIIQLDRKYDMNEPDEEKLDLKQVKKDPMMILEDFFEEVANKKLNDKQKELAKETLDQAYNQTK